MVARIQDAPHHTPAARAPVRQPRRAAVPQALVRVPVAMALAGPARTERIGPIPAGATLPPAVRWIQCAGAAREVRDGLVTCPGRGAVERSVCLDCHLLETMAFERDPDTSCSLPPARRAPW